MWIGPLETSDVQKAYERMFAAELNLTGDVFFSAPETCVQKVHQKRFDKRGRYYPLEDVPVRGSPLLRLMPPGMPARRDAYTGIRGSSTCDFIADLDHWPFSPGGAYGSTFPCQLTHGHIWSWNKDRFAIGVEHLMAQGFHLFPSQHPDRQQK